MTTLTLERYRGHAWSYDCLETGWNYRIDEIRASLALAQMARLDGFLAARAHLRKKYEAALANSSIGIPFSAVRAGSGHEIAYHIMPVLLPRDINREFVMMYMRNQGIQTSIHYPPAHLFKAVAADERTRLVKTEAIAERELTLPFYPGLTDTEVAAVCDALKDAVDKAG
jgi:dTDP-4-amino-4,6-dideoxygalactose transaminase